MTKLKAKFELYSRLQAIGFTFDEAVQLRRIEMTLQRWAERECGDEHGNAIERDEVTGKPFATYEVRSNTFGGRNRYPIADREAGALRRLKAIVDARNARNARKFPNGLSDADCHPEFIFPYHQSDPRGCAVYLVRTSDLNGQSIDQVYNRGLAVCC